MHGPKKGAMEMDVFIYRSKTLRNHTLVVPVQDDFSGVPQKILDELGELVFLKHVTLSPSDKRVGTAPAEEIIANLQTQRYHLQASEVRFWEGM